ncbi:hypothetical protein DFQ28_005540 [Apophysomyces sp. BC1034]|nr:hypothetical protein DFQ30_003155 [Apophysomyces sp. BC1015]KAG0193311.1 hypothetical protein DFQ28_005540 [Apophysomyces sp. BC1034]
MSIEREIKLALPASQIRHAHALFAELTRHDGRAVALASLYFDTPERQLARAHGALRLRRTPDGWLQAFKFGGGASDGVHSRYEWEMAVAGEALEFDALLAACDNDRAGAVLRDAALTIVPLFRTDFTRTLWQIEWSGKRIEAALDIGEVKADVDGATRRAPICEIELELKDAADDASHVALDALAAVVKERLPGTAPEDISKAERGYQLRDAQ